MARRKPLSSDAEWSFELLARYDEEIARIAHKHHHLDTYPNQIEIISSEQMMDAYAAVGMPINYHHWSFGKHFVGVDQAYKRGQMGLAYEIVINSNPCIAYLMEENTMTMQALVIAHACYGHNSFFKGNYLFRAWTDASGIIDYLVFARQYIRRCEEKYGQREVEAVLDACHALMNYGVDRYKRPYPISAAEEQQRQEEREVLLQQQVNLLWRTLPQRADSTLAEAAPRFPSEAQENLLYFIEKNAPLLEAWQREVVRIVRKLAQYFYPQRQTQVMNEGWACFWHYRLLNDLYDGGLVGDGFMLEFLRSHTAVIAQPDYDSPAFNGINPYALGYAMYTDLRRICERPDAEDRRWFPEIAGSSWHETLQFAMRNFKDESFIQQFLSPRLMRQFRFFKLLDQEQAAHLSIDAIHDDEGYQSLRQGLSEQYNLSLNEPNIQVWNVDLRGDRCLTLRHEQHLGRPLGPHTEEVLKHLHHLWKFDVQLESMRSGQLEQRWRVGRSGIEKSSPS